MTTTTSIRKYTGTPSETASIQTLIANDLTEPYSVFTYRYFLSQWPNLCFISYTDDALPVACIVSKMSRKSDDAPLRGYVAMLAVEKPFRKFGIATRLVKSTIDEMRAAGCEWAYLETPTANDGALRLYENIGFVREKRLTRYYMNGEDAYRLKMRLGEEKGSDE